jgi:hypothetical protein
MMANPVRPLSVPTISLAAREDAGTCRIFFQNHELQEWLHAVPVAERTGGVVCLVQTKRTTREISLKIVDY